MRYLHSYTLLFSALLLLLPGCESMPGIEKSSLVELNRTARELQTAATSADPCEVPDALLGKLISGIDAIRNKAVSQEEKNLVKAYANLLATYHDGIVVCTASRKLAQPFLPKGRIYVFQELDPIVLKYGLSTDSHVYEPTGVKWRSIPADSIKVIWERAENQLKNIENMVKYS
ncbi:MAG: hypothetical protein M0042_16390 [Nitrospiraceae bacterium]|nr:hypothetical protein [Nitrospiraceae bacterium]